jgi:hypothetical protein
MPSKRRRGNGAISLILRIDTLKRKLLENQ